MRRAKSDYVIHTVRNALRVLEAFSDELELGVTELARRLNLPKNNVFRILATLEQQGYVEQVGENEGYRLGARCLELGRAYGESHSLLRLAQPLLEDLVRGSGESAHLGELRELEVVHLAGEQGGQLVQTKLRIGVALPAHCTALGKVMLACSQPGEPGRLERLWFERGLAPRTPQTLVDRDKLLEHLHGVATQGFAVDLEECEPGLHCAAAPVFGPSGRLVGALSISGPAFRLCQDTLLRRAVPAVLDAAQRLSRQLGFVHAA